MLRIYLIQQKQKRSKLESTVKVLRDQISQIRLSIEMSSYLLETELKTQRWENAQTAWLSLLVMILIYLGLMAGGYIK